MNKKAFLLFLFLFIMMGHTYASATGATPIPSIDFKIGTSDNPSEVADSIKILLLLTILSIGPAILILMTCFTRVIVILSFTRNALGTQQMPPNQVLIGLALFITFFVMSPTLSAVNEQALQPYLDGKVSQEVALDRAVEPMKTFMLKYTRTKDLGLFLGYLGVEKPKEQKDIPLTAVVPAFVISELKTAFQIGFVIFIPFLIIDMIVSSVLMAMGMMMLPPVMISLPFKILLFVLVDGWYLIVKSLLMSFQ